MNRYSYMEKRCLRPITFGVGDRVKADIEIEDLKKVWPDKTSLHGVILAVEDINKLKVKWDYGLTSYWPSRYLVYE